MTLTEFRYIIAVADAQHFGNAAQKCSVSQPTLSVGIRKLEEELGVTIFERHKNDVRITEVGQKIIAKARNIIEQTSAINDLAHGGHDVLASPVKIGAIYTVAPFVFPQLIKNLHPNTPKLPLYLREGFTYEMREFLRSGDLDVIIVSTPFSEANTVITPLYREKLQVVMSADNQLANKDLLEKSDLEKAQVLLLGEHHCLRDQIIQAFPNLLQSLKSHDQEFKSVYSGSSIATLYYMISMNLGITILPEHTLKFLDLKKHNLIIKDFAEPVPYREVVMGSRRGFSREIVLQKIKDSIQAS